FPYHQLDNYLRRLIQAGFRAAVCEQVEDPALAKGLVKREVTRVVTPGTLTDDALLDPRHSNFLAAVCADRDNCGLAGLALSTRPCVAAEIGAQYLQDELARLAPAECLVPEGHVSLAVFPAGHTLATERAAWCFSPTHCRRVLLEHFGTTTLDGFGWDDEPTPAVTAAGALLEYVQETQKSALNHITRLEPFVRGSNLLID